jgi:hypothetical protein
VVGIETWRPARGDGEADEIEHAADPRAAVASLLATRVT